MILYKFITTTAKALAFTLTGPPPNIFTMPLEVAWMGEIINHIEVEIRESPEKLGWLYSNASLLFYEHKEDMYECSIQKLKEFTESKLKEKKYSDTPAINCLSKVNGRIITLISVEDLLALSSKVVIKE